MTRAPAFAARRALLALGLVLATEGLGAGSGLPERHLAPDHPCLLPDALFAPLAREGEIETRRARLAEGTVVLRTTASLPAPAGDVLALLADVEGWPRFVRRIRSLARRPGEPPVFHVVFDAPWPLSDRDYGLAPAVARDEGGGGTVFWEPAPERLPPERPGVVRVESVRGGFAVSPGASPGSSSLVYTELDAFGDTLPAFARETARSRGPGEIVAALRALLAARGDPEAAATPPARAAGRARIVDAASLRAELGSATPPLVLDARPRRDFERGHVPGSRPADWRDFTAVRPNVGSYLFGDPSRWGLLADDGPALAERLGALGLSDGRPVVVVGDPHGWGEEGRIAWMLLALGVGDVALLEGGFPAWRDLAGAVLERGRAASVAPGGFRPVPRPERRIRLDALRSLLAEGRRPLLDARTREEFEGRRLRGQERGGRIPGARLVPAAALRDASGRYVNAEELARLAGPLEPGRPPVTYCTGGVRSALLAVLLEARLGVVAANYDGSLWEWGARPELPLVTGPSR